MDFRAYASSSAGNFYTVSSGDATLALDCGLRLAEIRLALGFAVTRLAGCLLTHSHMDHARAVGGLLRSGVDVYASAGCWGALEALRGEWRHRCYDLTPRQEVAIGPFRVLPFEAVHDAPGALGFLIGAPDGDRLVFLVDSAYARFRFAGVTHWAIPPNFSRELLTASDAPPEHKRRLLRNHMSLESALELLDANDLTPTREIHLLHLSNRHGDPEAFCRAVQRATGKPTFAAPRDWRKT